MRMDLARSCAKIVTRGERWGTVGGIDGNYGSLGRWISLPDFWKIGARTLGLPACMPILRRMADILGWPEISWPRRARGAPGLICCTEWISIVIDPHKNMWFCRRMDVVRVVRDPAVGRLVFFFFFFFVFFFHKARIRPYTYFSSEGNAPGG